MLRPLRAPLVAAAALTLLALPLTTVSAATPPPVTTLGGAVELPPGDPAFFTPPDPVPAGDHGTLLRFQQVASSSGQAWRILYLSTTPAGQPTVVTGLVSIPDDRIPPFGGRPLLLYGHGTIGLADQCAPSRYFDNADEYSGLTGPGYSSEFESIGRAEPWAVVATDFEGLGGPGGHPYLVGISHGRSILDAGLAARQLPMLYASDTTAIAGWSQGGYAALWALQLAAEWAPDLDIVGSALAAPPAEPAFFVHRGATDPAYAMQALVIVAGYAAAYPEAQAALGSVLSPAGLELVALVNESCLGQGVPGYDPAVPVPAGLFTTDPTTVEPFASLLAANGAAAGVPAAPALVVHYPEDFNVPIEQGNLAKQRLCAGGQAVEVRPGAGYVPGPPGEPFSHNWAFRDLQNEGLRWLTGLLDGSTTPVSSC